MENNEEKRSMGDWGVDPGDNNNNSNKNNK